MMLIIDMEMEMTDFNAIVDNAYNLKLEYEAIEALYEAAKKTLKESGYEKIEGNTATAKIALFEKKTLDAELVKKFLTAEQLEQCYKTTDIYRITFKAKINVYQA